MTSTDVTAPLDRDVDLGALIKAYDVRGVVPDQLDAALCERLGAAFAHLVDAPVVVLAHDMRDTSPELVAAFARGVTGQGTDVVDAGLGSTDLLYFASGHLRCPGAMFTASHNPAQYNGIKMCRAGASPIGQDTGLAEIRRMVEQGVPAVTGEPGRVSRRELLAEYAAHLLALVDLTGGRRLKVVVDAGNGMAGLTVPRVLEGQPVDLVPMYFELDGSFPNHEANPLEPANLLDLQAKVVEVGADLGLAFDGDADRCFVVDERGAAVTPSAVTGLVATRELAKQPGATIIHNLITSRAVPEIVAEHGGVPVRTRVGHSFIKARMAETGAVFGGEHSAHYYFASFWNADTGMLAGLHVLAALGETDAPLSQLMAQFSRYAAAGEVNSAVADAADRTAAVLAAFGDRDGVTTDTLDGLTVSGPDGSGWWFNLRPSNTEPLLRLNVEAADADAMAALRDEVLAIVRA